MERESQQEDYSIKQVQEELLSVLEGNECQPKQKKVDFVKKVGRDFGFFDYSTRSKAYMLLFEITEEDVEGYYSEFNMNEKFEVNEVIVNDANRSFVGYSELKNLPPSDLAQQREELSYILHFFFHRYPEFSYYQGLNTVAELFLLVFGKSLGYLFLERISLRHLKKFLTQEEFEKEISHQMAITLHILQKEVPEFNSIFGIEEDEDQIQERLGFIVGWIVTWFSHKMSDLTKIFRLFDFLVCSPPHSISLISALVIRESIRSHDLSNATPLENMFMVLYNMNMDEVPWNTIISQVKILESMEDYSKLDPKSKSKILSRFKGRWNRIMKDQNTVRVKTSIKKGFEAGMNWLKSAVSKKGKGDGSGTKLEKEKSFVSSSPTSSNKISLKSFIGHKAKGKCESSDNLEHNNLEKMKKE